MNPLNYASLSASKRLVDAGVVLKTEVYWSYEPTNIITPRCNQSSEIIIERRWVLTMFPPMGSACYPAASMAEAWRELPDRFDYGGDPPDDLFIKKAGNKCIAGYGLYSDTGTNINPTDALIDLLVFVKGLDTPKRRKAMNCEKVPPTASWGHNYYLCTADDPIKQRECSCFEGSDLDGYCRDNDADKCLSMEREEKSHD